MQIVALEFRKSKRRNFWFAIIGLFVFTLIWCVVSTNTQLAKNSSPLMRTIIFNMMTIDNLIFPFLIALLTVRLVQPEHDNRMVQVLMTNGERPWTLFLAKFLTSSIVLLIGELLQAITIIIFGILKGNQVEQMGNILFFIAAVFLSGLVITLVQLIITFYVKRPSMPLCIGLAGSFLSLVTSGFLPKPLEIFIPWQYVALLNPFLLQKMGLVYNNLWPIYMLLAVGIIGILFILVKHEIETREKVPV
ncbi:ABC transporter permease [Lentilactobacillus fungorum]|uniref:ABC transporter permease n=1 Tax=Lentilactobacillus fungorum TaxID=2201250 RepID=UPI00194549F4|nr:ABC transporter permease [Lentilactobacillus fungorum]